MAAIIMWSALVIVQLSAVATAAPPPAAAQQSSVPVDSASQVLQMKMMQAQMVFARQNVALQQQLKAQADESRAIDSANVKIASDSEAIKLANAGLRVQAKNVQKENNVMRSEIRALQSKWIVAKDFMSNALSQTDDFGAEELAVFRSSKEHQNNVQEQQVASLNQHSNAAAANEVEQSGTQDEAESEQDGASGSEDESEQDEGKDEDDDSDAEQVDSLSFLGVSSKRTLLRATSKAGRAHVDQDDQDDQDDDDSGDQAQEKQSTPAPSAFLGMASDVQTLVGEENGAEGTLVDVFKKDFEAGTRHRTELLTQQMSLNATHASYTELHEQLRVGVEHLQGTHRQLRQRLVGLGQFMQRLAGFAMAPIGEAPRLLGTLPSGIVMVAEAPPKSPHKEA